MEHNNFSELYRYGERLKNNFGRSSEAIAKRNVLWERFAKQYPLTKSSEAIKIKVGGYRFTVLRASLLSVPKTKFEELITNPLKSEEDEIFIDRPGKYFDVILRYLRKQDFNINGLDLNQKLALIEEAEYYGLTDLAEELIVLDSEAKALTHNHTLKKKKITGDWVCRGKFFYENHDSCKEKDKMIKWKYICEESNCKDVEYCITCIERDEKSFKCGFHSCKLNWYMGNNGWSCNAGREKDGCLSGFKDFYKTTKEIAFACRSCNFDLCERCFIHYGKNN